MSCRSKPSTYANRTLRAFFILPNVPDQRPRATDVRHGTETQSRGSLHPVCSAAQSCEHHNEKSDDAKNDGERGHNDECAKHAALPTSQCHPSLTQPLVW